MSRRLIGSERLRFLANLRFYDSRISEQGKMGIRAGIFGFCIDYLGSSNRYT